MTECVLSAGSGTRGFVCSVSILHDDCAGERLLFLFLDEETEVQSFAQSHSSGASLSSKVSSTLKIMFLLLHNTASPVKTQIYKNISLMHLVFVYRPLISQLIG